jgi:hypothetical protein
MVQGSAGHGEAQDLAVGWLVSRTGDGKRRQGSGVARTVFSRAIVAASAITNFAEPPPTLTERLSKRVNGRSAPRCTAWLAAPQVPQPVRGWSTRPAVAQARPVVGEDWAR